MKTLFLTKLETLEWRDAAAPTAGQGDVRVRMRYVGICGSDVHYYMTGRIGDQIIEFPHILGHEGSGEVIEGGGFARGTPVYIEPAMPCHQCDQCLAGRENTCRKLQFLGNPHEAPGLMREEVVMPAECVIPLPEWLTLDVAPLLEPLCIAAHAVFLSRAAKGSRVAIVGAGPIGLTTMIAASDFSPRQILVSEPVAKRREIASRLGAQATFDPGAKGAAEQVMKASDGGVNVAFDCCGTPASLEDAARMLAPGGTLVIVGIPEVERVPCDIHLWRRRELTVVNVRRQNRALDRALALAKARTGDLAGLITHHFRPVQANDALHLVEQKRDGVIKAMLEF